MIPLRICFQIKLTKLKTEFLLHLNCLYSLLFLMSSAVTLQSETASSNCLTENNWIYYIIPCPVPKNSRSISKSSPLNLADTRVGKSLNKNKFVYVLGEGARQEDVMLLSQHCPQQQSWGGSPSTGTAVELQPVHQLPPSEPTSSSRQAVRTQGWLLHWGR